MNKKKKLHLKKSTKKIIINTLIIVLVIIFIYSIFNMTKILYFSNKTKQENKELFDLVINTESNKEVNKANTELEVDFDKLQSLNRDVIGWIEIPDTNINYPIVKTIDNNYYLTHSIYKKYNINGSIFMDYGNNSDFTDSNTIIYGHNTNNREMFSDLKKIYNGELGKNIKINIYTPDGNYQYQIYATYVADPDDATPLNKTISSFDKSDREFVFDKVITKTLTLSTCLKDSSKRIIIHAALLENSNNKEN